MEEIRDVASSGFKKIQSLWESWALGQEYNTEILQSELPKVREATFYLKLLETTTKLPRADSNCICFDMCSPILFQRNLCDIVLYY